MSANKYIHCPSGSALGKQYIYCTLFYPFHLVWIISYVKEGGKQHFSLLVKAAVSSKLQMLSDHVFWGSLHKK